MDHQSYRGNRISEIVVILAMFMGFSTSCKTTRIISIQILLPSPVTLPAEQEHFIMINRVSMLTDTSSTDSIRAGNVNLPVEYYKQLSWEAVNGSLVILDQSPKIDTVVLDTAYRESLAWTYGQPRTAVDSLDIRTICSGSSATGVIILDDMIISDSMNVKPMYLQDSSDILGYYAFELIYPGLKWQIFGCNGRFLHESTYSDTLIWEGSGISPEEAYYQLPPLEENLLSGIRYAGRIFGYSIAPTWIGVNRLYYITGNKEMRDAAGYAGQNNWDAAARMWKNMAEADDRELASKAAFNMALVAEIKDRIDLALTWINKSYELQEEEITKQYAQVLRTRFNHRKELSKQVQNLE